jgi:AraC-like DNA-binding protein
VLYGLYNPELLVNYFKYQSSSLDDNLKNQHYHELLRLLDQKKLYLDPLLNLEKLARSLNISGKQLSQLINETAGNNFNDFINRYRIEEAQMLIKKNNEGQPNILTIAYEVGFNSKSTFNTAFKKFTNSTPTEYRKRVSQPENLIPIPTFRF